MKKILAVLMAVLTLVSVGAASASAQTSFYLGSNSYSYNRNGYCYVSLKKPGKKNASVKVTLVATGALTIKMTDGSGRYLWSENYSIRPNQWNNAARTYTLGKDHSSYRLYFKMTNGRGYGRCYVGNAKNCSIA